MVLEILDNVKQRGSTTLGFFGTTWLKSGFKDLFLQVKLCIR